ncbi:hypothetical protein GC209_17745 [bacterium]|nr:hypothetical protein [bacterium]
MRIVYHLGAHCTDDERLLRCLLKNRGTLAAQGIVVPGPTRYRNLMRDTAIALNGQAASVDTQALVLEQIMEEGRAERLILSWENFLALAPWVVDGALYPAAGDRTRAFTQIFPQIGAEFHLAIRNPAGFLPAVYAKQKKMKGGKASTEDFLKGVDLFGMRWSQVVEDIRAANPDVPLTVWCDEDTPLIWPEVLQAVAGQAPGTVLEDEDELLTQLMPAEGTKRMQAYIDSHPVTSVEMRRRIVSAFLDKFALKEKISTEIEMPGWTEATVETLTLHYEQDVARIAATPGVRFIAP